MLLTFEALAPWGSLIYQSEQSASFVSSEETDAFTIDLAANQTLAGVVLPGDGSIRARIEVLDPNDNSLGVFDASAASQQSVFQSLAIVDAGVYQVQVTSLEGAGPYELQLLLNAAEEVERFAGATNDTLATAQDIDGSFLSADGRGATRRGRRSPAGRDIRC